MIETYLLRGIAEIDRTGSFTAAAKALFVSQPALSRAMRKLEDELGVALFDRSTGRTALSPLGRLAAEHARLALAAIDGLAAAVREADRARRVLRYGTIAPAPMWTLDPLLGKIFPDRRAEADIRETEAELLDGLADGSFEMAVLLRTPPGAKWRGRAFLRERLGVLLPEGHRLARRRALRFADLAGETFVMHGTIGFWAPLSRERIPRAKFFLQETLEALRSIVETVALPSFYTDLSLEAVPIPPGKAAIPLRDPEATATYHLVCRADRAAALAPLFAALPSLPAAR
jgi:DNA-binding transcriptional LysR family regulator